MPGAPVYLHMTRDNPAQAGRREWLGLAVIALPCLLYSMDLTVLHLAVPALSADLQPTSAQLLWLIDIYGFFVAGFLITMGTLGDRIGRRRLLLIGMALLLVLGPLVLPEFKDPDPGKLDLLSAAMSLTAVLAAIYGLKQTVQDGVGWLPALAALVGISVGIAFVVRQRRLADPLIDLRLFSVPAFSGSLAVYTLSILVLFGAFFFMFQYLQLVKGLSPIVAGLWTLPSFVAFIVGSMLAPALVSRVRPVVVMAPGLAVAALGFGVLALVDEGSASCSSSSPR